MGADSVRELEDRIQVLTAFTGGIIFELDRDGRYLRVWAGDPALLVRPEAELIGQTVSETLGEPSGERFHAMFRRVADTGVPETFDYALDVRAGRRTFRCEAQRRAGAPPTVILLVRDITEQTELSAKLVAAERLAAVGTLAASVGHEIRQPLAFASTSLEVLGHELDGKLEGRAGEALEHVRDAVRRINEIAASMRMVASDRRGERRVTDVRRPVEAALDLCASETRGRARVTVRVDGAPRVVIHEAELCQVLSNVILNAAQASAPAVSTTNEIVIEAHVCGDELRILVADGGIGIPEDVLPRIFDPFFTTKDPGRGTGLGLYVSKALVERSGGRIEVSARPGGGTLVSIALPLAEPSERPPEVAPEPAPQVERLRLLVVDDEPMFLRSLQLLLFDKHDVTAFRHAPEALEVLRTDPTRFDMVLCDLSMPEVDGVTFHAEMDRLGIGDRFVLMTGGAYTPRTEQFLERTRCPRIAKPFTRDELDVVLASAKRRG